MDNVARLPATDRTALFGETGAGRGVANTIVEKDFWVCWTLKRLFGMQRSNTAALVFKGGTSLSNAFGAIRRFSEDIDLSFDRSDLGYSGSRDPTRDGISRKKTDQLIEDLMRDVEAHIAEKLLPALRIAIAGQLGEPADSNWSLEIDDADAHTVNFHYPTVLPETEYEGMAYITPRVRL
ncbi:nucleotidyl transferase AbiEii/AbiGii toxin family protein, partial [Gemmatimonas sp.]|uniref:nucleotidyl transferase AbiEii/AbiGii toxin family protein n=1 Tax=Gemmatimonas sp. TaxID=1962908 RepID=UPI00286BD794